MPKIIKPRKPIDWELVIAVGALTIVGVASATMIYDSHRRNINAINAGKKSADIYADFLSDALKAMIDGQIKTVTLE